MGWSYGSRSTFVYNNENRPFILLAPLKSYLTAPSVAEFFKEVDNILSDSPVTAEEVATSKNRSTLTLPGRWETARAVAGDIAELVRFGLPDDYWDQYAELVGELDARAVNAAAKRALAPDKLTWVIVGDVALIEDDVRALGLGDVRILDADGNIITTR
jgi:zinc protease